MPEFDLDAYLARIGYDGPRTVCGETLAALQLAHATHIPFENLDVLLGQRIALDSESLQAKLVTARRGGYCFEQNTLLLHALESLGFTVTRLLARVRYRSVTLRPRTHLLLRVELEGTVWLVDVGFGSEGLLQPLPLVEGQPQTHGDWHYRLLREGTTWVLQSISNTGWKDLYAFTDELSYGIDVEVASHYTSTHPDTIFKKVLTVQLPGLTQRTYLRNHELVTETATSTTTQPLTEPELLPLLTERFGLSLPEEVIHRLWITCG
ncbi:arylamine N-acetyltransferase family protein [Armatimonas rosea]|uniref:N-hydroxyarylamine O-acetyltransferase n=1 Tax=Armatimonas rosea TaxID=685828 RepID=A0A7W9SMJ1_ARMRO|nr:arylamine N-acetyltransferase [Armatimonas rosea]MBB6049392.1 N-hydroxyarylamine O-acetyltransferase [Armatimonas rosea]